jgi:tRNA-uridine 2-sulfurtransferase
VKVLVALSGGVDSSVAAAELIADGHEVVGITMRLWGGDSDTGCCSVADVDDARRVAQQLGIDHVVFNFTDDFHRHVVDPYVAAHAAGITPNPCIECNRHLKFDRLSERADVLGFDAVATGHHARIAFFDGRPFVRRGADDAKDQSYVVHMLPARELARTLFPVGHLTKAEVRARAAALGLRTAAKPDSQDVCFITHTGGREQFLGNRIPFRRATVVDRAGVSVGSLPSVEMVTLGQRRGIGLAGGGPKQYVVDIDHAGATVTVGPETDLLRDRIDVADAVWPHDTPSVGQRVMVQCSAHGAARAATVSTMLAAPLAADAHGIADDAHRTAGVMSASMTLIWDEPQRVVSPGQTVVWYDESNSHVLGGGIAMSA